MRSGHGGAGAVSFRREKYVPKGGPDGGDGGRGGDVVFRVKANVKTLSYVKMRRRFFARNGQPGAGRQKHGSRGDDVVIEVPPGTAVFDAESGEQLLDLTAAGDEHVLFPGGRGGKGNTHFKSARRQAPRFAQPGEEGQERRLRVELQVIADIGFVGLPNVGKSTLLKVLTAADPKVGNYPFTTVIPNLGVMHHHDHDVVLADIPGIIDGASRGAGLGLRFLKHIARTRGLAYVIDALDEDPAATLTLLRRELGAYDAQLPHKDAIVVVTKADLEPEEQQAAAREQILRETLLRLRDVGTDDGSDGAIGPDVVTVSAVTNTGLDRLRSLLVSLSASPSEAAPHRTDDR